MAEKRRIKAGLAKRREETVAA